MQWELTENAKSYEVVKKPLKIEIDRKIDAQDMIETATSMKLSPREELMSFIEQASKAYDDAGFTDKQKSIFLSKRAVISEEVRQGVALYDPKTFGTLMKALREYNELKERFGVVDSEVRSHSRQDARQFPSFVHRLRRKRNSIDDVADKVEALAWQLAEVMLLIRKNTGPAEEMKAVADRSSTPSGRIFGSVMCMYCDRLGHDDPDCWKMQRESMKCSYCKMKGHTEKDCWTKQQVRQSDIVAEQNNVDVLRDTEQS